jgi:hypothetical protein
VTSEEKNETIILAVRHARRDVQQAVERLEGFVEYFMSGELRHADEARSSALTQLESALAALRELPNLTDERD